MKCQNCGTDNPDEMSYCGKCGKKLISVSVAQRSCVDCGRAIPLEAAVCQYCGHDFRFQTAIPGKRTSMKGMLLSLAALVVGLWALFLAIADILNGQGQYATWEVYAAVDTTVAVALVGLGIAALLSGK